MNAIDVVKASLAAVETGRVMEYEESLTEDMVFAGPVPQPVGKRGVRCPPIRPGNGDAGLEV